MKVNIRDYLRWLTENITDDDKDSMFSSSIIQDSLDNLIAFADSTDDSINLLDSTTWKDYTFDRAEDMIWNSIAPRAAHQQRVENFWARHTSRKHVDRPDSSKPSNEALNNIQYLDG
jgi:hypothetical protein